MSASAAPSWFEAGMVFAGIAVLSFGGFGLLLAYIGHYSAVPALSLGALGTVVGSWLASRGRDRQRSADRAAVAPAVLMVLVAIGTALWNARYISHHVYVDRDPGVYAVTGRWIATHGSLIVPGGAGWTGKGSFDVASAGMYLEPGGHLQFQFAHMFPALLAESFNIGGDGLMFRLPAVLGAIGLCAVYAVGCRLVARPWLALAAVTGLAVSLPQLSVTRETYSEPSTQVLLWTGILLILRAYERRRASVALVAGAAIGGTLMTRIDGVSYLIALPVLAAACWLAARERGGRGPLVRIFAAFLAGALPPIVLGTLDVQRRAGGYYTSLRPEVKQLYAALALSALLALVVVVALPRLAGLRGWLVEHRSRIALVACAVAGFALLAMWALRPALQHQSQANYSPTIAGLQKQEGLAVNGRELYGQDTMRWMSWYLGPVTLALAVVGLCVLIWRAVRHANAAATLVLGITATLTAIYLWKPNITPDQIWAMRRFVPASLPLLVLAAAAALDAAIAALPVLGSLARSAKPVGADRLVGGGWRRPAVAVGAVGAVALVAFPLGTTLPVARFSWQANYLPVIDRTCETVGEDAAVLIAPSDIGGLTLQQTLRDWCDVPVARPASLVTAASLRELAAKWQADGRTLWVLGTTTATLAAVLPGERPTLIGQGVGSRDLVRTLTRAPDRYDSRSLAVYGVQVRP